MDVIQRLKHFLKNGPKKYPRAEKIERGRQAERLLNDPLLNECLESIELEIYMKWRSSEGGQVEGRHNLYLSQRLLDQIRRRLEELAYEGQHESKLEKQDNKLFDINQEIRRQA